MLYIILSNTALYYTILYYTIRYCTILYYTILCYILYYPILHHTIQYCTILYCTILYTILYYTILYHIILYYTILYYDWPVASNNRAGRQLGRQAESSGWAGRRGRPAGPNVSRVNFDMIFLLKKHRFRARNWLLWGGAHEHPPEQIVNGAPIIKKSFFIPPPHPDYLFLM